MGQTMTICPGFCTGDRFRGGFMRAGKEIRGSLRKGTLPPHRAQAAARTGFAVLRRIP